MVTKADVSLSVASAKTLDIRRHNIVRNINISISNNIDTQLNNLTFLYCHVPVSVTD